MSELKLKLGKRIQNLRKSQKITQEKFSENIGIDIASLSKIETGRNYPSPETLEKIAAALKLEPKDLFNFNSLVDADDLMAKIHDNLEHIKEDKEKLQFVCIVTNELV